MKSKKLLLRFGIPTLDKLMGSPRVNVDSDQELSDGSGEGFAVDYGIGLCSMVDGEAHHDAVSACIIGSDGVGKSILAMHLAARYQADIHQLEADKPPSVYYASTDLTFGRAVVSWQNFGLDYPNHRTEDPFDLHQLVRLHGCRPSAKDRLQLKQLIPLRDCFPDESSSAVHFIDLASHTTGDDWGYLNRLVGSLENPNRSAPKHLLVVDAVEGLEVLVGEVDAHGQMRDRRSRVAQLIRTAAEKCHLIFLVESQHENAKTPEEFVADVVVRLGATDDRGYMSRFVRLEKVRGQTHVSGSHTISIRSGRGSTTGKKVNPDDPPVRLPQYRYDDLPLFDLETDTAQRNIWQSYVYVFHSLHYINRQIMDAKGDRIERPDAFLAGFGIDNLDNMLSKRNGETPDNHPLGDGESDDKGPIQGDQEGFRVLDPVALVGEDGTFKSKLSKAFLARAQRPGRDGISILITSKTLEAVGLKERLDEHVASADREQHHVMCRRMEIHFQSGPSLFHIILQIVRRAQAILLLNLDDQGNYSRESAHKDWIDNESIRREAGWRIRLVIDNWTSIQEMYPRVKDDPLFLPCLLFFLRREGIATVIVANEDRGFSRGFELKSTFRLCDLTACQIFTWRVPFFGESRVAITITPPLRSDGRGSVIRELRMLKRPSVHLGFRPKHVRQDHSQKISVNPSFELYDGLERGDPHYVPLRIYLYSGSELAVEYFDDVRYIYDRLLNAKNSDELVLQDEKPENYDRLRDFCELQGVARYPYTLVLQVDEFWAKSNSLQLCSQYDYLASETADVEFGRPNNRSRIRVGHIYDYITNDPFRLFQPSDQDIQNKIEELNTTWQRGKRQEVVSWHRHEFFSANGYNLSNFVRKHEQHQAHMVKVPYAWDFGFLMLNRNAWEQIAAESKESDPAHFVWDRIMRLGDQPEKEVVNWFEFVSACCDVARIRNANKRGDEPSHYVPFAVAPELQETISCLFLEIWVSEIEKNGQKELEYFPCRRDDDESPYDLSEAIDHFKVEAIRALLLLSSLLPPEVITDDNFAKPQNEQNNIPVAVRTWYSAAEKSQTPNRSTDFYEPARLPGVRSVRGDWFLATARGSRSYQMGERAMDILCSRRGNILRLQKGIGLPVRDSDIEEDAQTELWTTLWRNPDTGQPRERVLYRELIDLGDNEHDDFCWLWRSRIPQYDRHSRILRRWICAVLRQRNTLLSGKRPLEVYIKMDRTVKAALVNRVDGLRRSLKRATIFRQSTKEKSR